MPKVTSPRYRAFIEKGLIETVGEDDLKRILDAVYKLKRVDHEALRAFLIVLYYTGRRPSEILDLKVGDVTVKDDKILFLFLTRKKGRAGKVAIVRRPLTEEFVEYWRKMKVWGPKAYLFPTLRSKRVKLRKTKKGEIREHTDIANKVYHYVKIVTKEALGEPLPPYFFRHNILTILAEHPDITPHDLMLFKGARSITSVAPYLHYSGNIQRKMIKAQKEIFG